MKIGSWFLILWPVSLFLFLSWNPINRKKELCGTTRINYSLWVFYSGFLGVPVNIKDPGAADRPDVLHRSHLTGQSGTEPWFSPSSPRFHSPTRHLCQAAVSSQSLGGSCWLVRGWDPTGSDNKVAICVTEGDWKAFWVQLFCRLWQSQIGFYTRS